MLKKLNKTDLKKIYDAVGNRRGWDFSRMKTEKEPAPWDYIEIVLKYLKPSDYVLDIGTGGGEKFSELSDYFQKGVGIDPFPDMINVAKENAAKNNRLKVSFQLMRAEDIQFPKGTFDVVINRHAVLIPSEVAKVLKPGGYLITQQVEKENMKNLKQVFNDRRSWQNNSLTLGHAFEKNGCRVIASGRYNVNYWVKDIESLIFWLKAVDLPQNFNIEDHGDQLMQYIEQYSTPKGFITNESREFMVVRKD